MSKELEDKYGPLRGYFEGQPRTTTDISLSFAHIEAILGSDLPASARLYRQWWSNDWNHVQAQAWLAAGWRTELVSYAMGEVWFGRVGDS